MLLLFVMSVVLWGLFQSVAYGVTIGLRLVCFVTATVVFLTCTRTEDFTVALSKLGLPFVVSFTLSLAFRLAPLFMETAQTIAMAQRARGLDLDSGGPLSRLRRHVPIIVPVLVSGLRRADQLAIALESKGFGGGKPRSVLSEYAMTWRDGALIAAVLVTLAAAIIV